MTNDTLAHAHEIGGIGTTWLSYHNRRARGTKVLPIDLDSNPLMTFLLIIEGMVFSNMVKLIAPGASLTDSSHSDCAVAYQSSMCNQQLDLVEYFYVTNCVRLKVWQ